MTAQSAAQNDSKSAVQDLEVKDASLIFNSVWARLEEEHGRENLRFPKEIIWLNGAPGSGKGTHTDFIRQFRDLTAPPVVVSDLLDSEEAQRMKDAGMLVGDREVTRLVFEALLNPVNVTGAVVDGYPRSKVQVECLKQLYSKMLEMREDFRQTLLTERFPKPHFHIVVLFVEERESVNRQIRRGKEIIAHNEKVRQSGVGEERELRKTDLSEEAALRRYKTFKDVTYESLKSLREVFFYHFINAHGPIAEVQQRIVRELQYQSSLELDPSTLDRLSAIPIASSLVTHARQELVNRLDNYERHHPDLFKRIIDIVQEHFMPIVRRHAISGQSFINTEDPIFEEPRATQMMLDVFSERGFHASIDLHKVEIPESIDPKTFKIATKVKKVWRVRISFAGTDIRLRR
jgi:adenylate kinase